VPELEPVSRTTPYMARRHNRSRDGGGRHVGPYERRAGVLGDDLHGADAGTDLRVGFRFGLAVAANEAAGGQPQELVHGLRGE
jgi:hypothetical protein